MTKTSSNGDKIRKALKGAGLEKVDQEILGKCAGLAKTLNLSPTEMADYWVVFSLNKNVSELTEHTFQSYRAELKKNADKISTSEPSQSSSGSVPPEATAAVVRRPALGKRQMSEGSIPLVTPPSNKRLNKDGGSSTGVSAVDRVAVPSHVSSSPTCVVSKPASSISETGLTRASVSPPVYSERTGVGQVVVSFNPQQLPPLSAQPHLGSSKLKCSISYDFSTNVKKPYRHMFTTLEERADALNDCLMTLGNDIAERYGIRAQLQNDDIQNENAIAPLEAVGVPSQDKVCCIGRICNSAHEGRINLTSVVLEGSRLKSGGSRIDLDLAYLKNQKSSFSLFPGQIVAVEGMNPTGRKMVAHRICEGAAHEPQKSSVQDLMKYHHHEQYQDGKPIKIISVCGPYTTSDNLDYSPLVDFIQVIQAEKPDVVIMVGPFVDLRHKMIRDGEATLQFDDGSQTFVTLEAFFANKVAAAFVDLVDSNPDIQTQFVLVPSLDDGTAEWVYPQPPFRDDKGKELPIEGNLDIRDDGTLGLHHVETAGGSNKKGFKRVHCVSNPCTLRINELVIGVSGIDTIFHLSADETNANLELGSRLARISQHMLQQQSYYPIYPAPPAADAANLDWKNVDKWKMPCRPDILICPSKLATFCKTVLKSTVVLNPGYLSRDTTGGTYAVLQVHPMQRETLETNISEAGADAVELEHRIADRIQLEIRRV